MRNYFTNIARSLMESGEHTELARRYLTIRERERLVHLAIKAAMREHRNNNPLAAAGFVPPLSLAGRTESILLARAEWMIGQGITVALSCDSKGRHVGTPLDETLHKLHQVHPGRRFTDMEVLDLYQQLVAPSPAALENDLSPRTSTLPGWSNRLAIQRRWLEDQLRLIATKARRTRFAAVVSKGTVEAVLSQIPQTMDKMALVISFTKNAGVLIDGKAVETAWGQGSGLAVICRTDLAALMARAQHALTIECFLDHWIGWADSGPAGVPEGYEPRHMEFHYFVNPWRD